MVYFQFYAEHSYSQELINQVKNKIAVDKIDGIIYYNLYKERLKKVFLLKNAMETNKNESTWLISSEN